MIDFGIIIHWIMFLICGIWLLSIHGFILIKGVPYLNFAFSLIYMINIFIEVTWLPSCYDFKAGMFYYG